MTIEERTIKLQKSVTPHKTWGDVNYGYVHGASDQKEITKKEMIDKACEFLIGFTTYPYTKKGNVSKKLLNEFRKFMEN